MEKTSSKTFIEEHALPAEVKNALNERRVVETPGGTYTLAAWREMKLCTVLVDHLHCPDVDPMPGDPNGQRQGWYSLPAYPLVCKTQGLLVPEEVLLWLPGLNLYGCYDSGRQQLYVYPDTTWAAIEHDLPHFLVMYKDTMNIRCHLRVWEHFDFIPANFPAMTGLLLNAPVTDDQLRDARLMAWHYERPLLSLPFHNRLGAQYLALLNLYLHLAWHDTSSTPADKTEWLDKGAVLTQGLQQYIVALR